MVNIFRRVVFIFAIVTIFSACFWQNNVEAKANISWTTTDVVLEFGKCTVKGYFTNSGDMGGTVTKMKFIVDVKTSQNGSQLYSATWEYSPESCYIPAGTQENWSFWYNDEKGCPSWSSESHWAVNYTISYK